jgi:NADPH-dependent 2,4-dienoyl-CoA reductase/sulfur reductase-like enzyme
VSGTLNSARGDRRRLVVVGGDAAGMSAATQARRLAPDLDIVVLEAGPHISYAACGISLLVDGTVSDPAKLTALTPESAWASRNIEARTGHRVQTLDVRGRTVAGVIVETGEEFAIEYDRLVVATGARPVKPPLPGVDLPGVFTVRRLQHGLALRADLDARRPGRAVVVGAGFVGIDLAGALRARSLAVTLIKDRATPLLGLEPELSAVAEEALVRHGCLLLRDAPLFGIDAGPDGGVSGVRAGGEKLEADLVVLAVGVRPCVDLADQAGLRLGPGGAIHVNQHGNTSESRVYAAGDCATQIHRVTGLPAYVTQALAANRQGRVAGANAALDLLGAAGQRQTRPAHPGTLGTAVLKIFDAEVGMTGLDLAAARESGRDAVVTVITARTQPGYHPVGGPMKVALIAERRTGKLLGGQVAGHPGAAKRIDTLATALHAGLDLATLADVDLGYAPAFSPVRDPILIAARAALKKI